MLVKRKFEAYLRKDLGAFIAKCHGTLNPGSPFLFNWHIWHLAYELSRRPVGQALRLVIAMPPRYGKSMAVSIAYIAWLMGRNPALRVIVVSYSEELARQHARDFKAIVTSGWYQALFPAFKIARADKLEVETTAKGYRKSRSMTGSILGDGGDLVVIDDPMKVQTALSKVQREQINSIYDHTIYGRLNNKNIGGIIIVGHRLHQNDLAGHVMSKEAWEQVVIPAVETEDRAYRWGPEPFQVHQRRRGDLLHPERENQAAIDVARRTLGSAMFSAQCQQAPVPDAGVVIKREWLRYYDHPPAEFDLVVASWDVALGTGENNDYSVGTVWGLRGTDIYLLDRVRERLQVGDLQRRVVELSQRHRVQATLMEHGHIGMALWQEMRRSAPVRLILRPVRGDKEVRLQIQSPKFEAGQVLLSREAPWLAEYVSELLAFPNGRHDDQVDSTSQALEWLSGRIPTYNPHLRPERRRQLHRR